MARAEGQPSFVRRTAAETALWFGDRGKNIATVLVPSAFIFPVMLTGLATAAVIGVFFDEMTNEFIDKGRVVESNRLAKFGYKENNILNKFRLAWNPKALWPYGTGK